MAALALVAVWGAADLVWAAQQTPPPPVRVGGAPAADPVIRADESWAPVRAELARRDVSGVVGYWGTVRAGDIPRNPAAVERLYRAQFALTPCVLAPDARTEWVVCDVGSPAPAGYVNTARFAGGRALWREATPAAADFR